MGNLQKLDGNERSLLTRREFMGDLALASAALTAMPVLCARSEFVRDRDEALVAQACSNGVVSFHMDQPYLDATATAMPYCSPRGMRSAAPVAYLSEEAFRRIHYYA
jgi:hypothetical protein